MVKLRLRRKGRIHHPIYDIIAIDERKKRDGAFIERLGYFDPNKHPSFVSIDCDRALYWLNVGAQPTNIVRKILKYEGILLRKYLALKGKNQVEIEDSVKLHQEVARARYFRQKDLREKKIIAKEKAKAEQEGKPAEVTPVIEEAPAKEVTPSENA
jgi:small subunit ribosomal protein S16